MMQAEIGFHLVMGVLVLGFMSLITFAKEIGMWLGNRIFMKKEEDKEQNLQVQTSTDLHEDWDAVVGLLPEQKE